MVAKQTISEKDFPMILKKYNLGDYLSYKTFANGAGQTTLLIITTKGKFVLRYYENRPLKHVLFEIKLFHFLKNKEYPLPEIIKTKDKKNYSIYNNKPLMVIEYIKGKHCKNPNEKFEKIKIKKIVKIIARMHSLTEDYSPSYFKTREIFDKKYCFKKFKENKKIKNKEIREEWLKKELKKIKILPNLPKGLCHADLNYGNFLFRKNKIVAVLDFDMSFPFYFIYDLASLLYWWGGHPKTEKKRMKYIVQQYSKFRKLKKDEKRYIFDALKLIILLGIAWDEEDDFEKEKKKVEELNLVGREDFLKIIS